MAQTPTGAATNAAVKAANRAVQKAAKHLRGVNAQSSKAKEAMRMRSTHQLPPSRTVSPEDMLHQMSDKMPQCIVAPAQLCAPPRIDGRPQVVDGAHLIRQVVDGAHPRLWQRMPQQVGWVQPQQQRRPTHPRYPNVDQYELMGTARAPWQQHGMGWQAPIYGQMPRDVTARMPETPQAWQVRGALRVRCMPVHTPNTAT